MSESAASSDSDGATAVVSRQKPTTRPDPVMGYPKKPNAAASGGVEFPLTPPCATRTLTTLQYAFRHIGVCTFPECHLVARAIVSPGPIEGEGDIASAFLPLVKQERALLTHTGAPAPPSTDSHAAAVSIGLTAPTATAGVPGPDAAAADSRASALLAGVEALVRAKSASVVAPQSSTDVLHPNPPAAVPTAVPTPAPALPAYPSHALSPERILGQLDSVLSQVRAEAELHTGPPANSTWAVATTAVRSAMATLAPSTPVPSAFASDSQPSLASRDTLYAFCSLLQGFATAASSTAVLAAAATPVAVATSRQLDRDMGDPDDVAGYQGTVYTSAPAKTARGITQLGHPLTRVLHTVDFDTSSQRPYVLAARLARLEDSRVLCDDQAAREMAAWHAAALSDCSNASAVTTALRDASPVPLAFYAPASAFIAQPGGEPHLPISALSQALETMACVYERRFGRDHALADALREFTTANSFLKWYTYYLDPDGARRVAPVPPSHAALAAAHVATLFDSGMAQWHRASMRLLWAAFDGAQQTRQGTIPYSVCRLPSLTDYFAPLPSTSAVAMTRMSLPLTLPGAAVATPRDRLHQGGGAAGPRPTSGTQARHNIPAPVPGAPGVSTTPPAPPRQGTVGPQDITIAGWPSTVTDLLRSPPLTWALAVAAVPELTSLRYGGKQVCGRFLLHGSKFCSGVGCSRAHVTPTTPPA